MIIDSTKVDVNEAYKTSSKGDKYCNETLNAVATVDQKNMAIRAYLYAIFCDLIRCP